MLSTERIDRSAGRMSEIPAFYLSTVFLGASSLAREVMLKGEYTLLCLAV